MTRALRMLPLLAAAVAAVPAAAQPMPALQPLAMNTVGPWEIVVWGVGLEVQHCTLVRAGSADPQFGVMVDEKLTVMSVETPHWKLRAMTTVHPTLTLPSGERSVAALAISPTRANIHFGKDRSYLDELARAPHLDIRIAETSVRVPLDGVAAGLAAFNACVQRLGKEFGQRPGQ
jgi:hypothetical protein